jgi:hypothetical protein
MFFQMEDDKTGAAPATDMPEEKEEGMETEGGAETPATTEAAE